MRSFESVVWLLLTEVIEVGVEIIEFSGGRRGGPDVRGGDTAADVPRNEITEYCTSTHFEFAEICTKLKLICKTEAMRRKTEYEYDNKDLMVYIVNVYLYSW